MATSKVQNRISPPAGLSGGMQKSEEFSTEKEKSAKKDSSGSRREPFFIDKSSNEMKWQRAKMVVGALAVKSNPYFQPKEDLKTMYKNDGGETKWKFEDALLAWEDLNLRKSFLKACVDLPDSACCCGFTQNDNSSTIKHYVSLLNEGWVRHANNKLQTRGFKIDTFFLSFQNFSGKTEFNTLLIRFFELSTYKFRRASRAGSLDLNAMLLHAQDAEDAEDDEA